MTTVEFLTTSLVVVLVPGTGVVLTVSADWFMVDERVCSRRWDALPVSCPPPHGHGHGRRRAHARERRRVSGSQICWRRLSALPGVCERS
jgi:hypothetical protein